MGSIPTPGSTKHLVDGCFAVRAVIPRPRAGNRPSRRWQRRELVEKTDAPQATVVLRAFRTQHQVPLTKVVMSARSVLATEGLPVGVSQRLKKTPTIIDKLRREPTLALSRMQDIGSCQVIVANIAEVRRVDERLRALSSNRVVHSRDHIVEPKASGYRSLHTVVERNGRMIETQLRTIVMHDWAVAVERLGGRAGIHLESGDGPHEAAECLRPASEATRQEQEGSEVSADLRRTISDARNQALPWLERPM